MKTDILHNIFSIIEQDSTSTTYKFGLLRGTIEVIQENSPYIIERAEYYEMPFYFLIEKWIVFYYNFYEGGLLTHQINGDAKLAFEKEMIEFIKVYKKAGGIRVFLKEVRQGSIPQYKHSTITNLFKKVRAVINNMPMKHLGYSINGETYSVYPKNQLKRFSSDQLNLDQLIDGLGNFKLEKEYYQAFRDFGHILTGSSSIISRWSDFSVNASQKSVSKAEVIANLTNSIEVLRDTESVRKIVIENDLIKCIWSGKYWELSNLEIDHIIPFSLYHNNDLWNLMPTTKNQNRAKLDEIPSEQRFIKSKDRIVECWKVYQEINPVRFHNELRVSLIGKETKINWENKAFDALIERSKYLVFSRKLKVWN